jgi:hypothetical protein
MMTTVVLPVCHKPTHAHRLSSTHCVTIVDRVLQEYQVNMTVNKLVLQAAGVSMWRKNFVCKLQDVYESQAVTKLVLQAAWVPFRRERHAVKDIC